MIRRPAILAAGLAALALLGGCAEAQLAGHLATLGTAESRPTYHVGEPYERAGQRVVPAERFAHEEVGLASWYGPGLQGRRTANGEIFDMNQLTAAHPSLQLPAVALVTNLDNGRTVRVRINDRGPIAGDRILDVSRRAAELLGFRRQGVARVQLRVLEEESLALRTELTGRPAAPQVATRAGPSTAGPSTAGPSTAGPSTAGTTAAGPSTAGPSTAGTTAAGTMADHWIDAATFRDRAAAEVARSDAATVAPARLESLRIDGADYWRLRLGPFDDPRSAEAALQVAWRAGLPDARLSR